MALQVWLPLNGNLNNNGCSGTVWKTSTATVNSAGKIGSCYNLAATSGNGIYLDTNSMSVTDFLAKYINNHSWSIMGWFKTTTTANLTPLWGITYGLRLYVGSKLKVCMNNASGEYALADPNLNGDGKWHHAAATYDVKTNKVRIYLDGVLKNEGTYNVSGSNTYSVSWTNSVLIGRDSNAEDGTRYFFNGSLNDFRLYDNCLSTKQISEISKGLICHYNFEEENTKNQNIVYDCSGYGHNGIVNNPDNSNKLSRSTTTCLGQHSALINGTTSSTISSLSAAHYIKSSLALTDPEEITISIFGKITLGYQNSGLIAATSLSEPSDYNNAAFNQYDSSLAFHNTDGTTVSISSMHSYVENSAFKHYVFTFDGKTAKMFIDSNLVKTASGSSKKLIKGFTSIFLGLSCAGGARRNSNGLWSDFRVYATCLTENEIKHLYKCKFSIDKENNFHSNGGCFVETAENIIDKMTYEIESGTNKTESGNNGNTNKKNYGTVEPNRSGTYYYTQPNLSVTSTAEGVKIYSAPNLTQSKDGDTMWGGLCFSPMKVKKDCMVKGHRYILCYHIKGKSSRQFEQTHPYFIDQIGWGHNDCHPNPTTNKHVSPPSNFNGEMDCYWDFTINDDIWKTVKTASGNTSYTVGETYLSYYTCKLGYTYGNTGSLGTDVYITNIAFYDITDLTKSQPELSSDAIAKLLMMNERSDLDKLKMTNYNSIIANEFIEN